MDDSSAQSSFPSDSLFNETTTDKEETTGREREGLSGNETGECKLGEESAIADEDNIFSFKSNDGSTHVLAFVLTKVCSCFCSQVLLTSSYLRTVKDGMGSTMEAKLQQARVRAL
eukprot:344258-Hanusia_phi.AAC.1